MNPQIPSWRKALKSYFESTDFLELSNCIDQAYTQHIIYPEYGKIFYAFELTPFSDVHVVIVGQDPYIKPDQAMGMSFSVPDDQSIPPSLQNIYKEVESDLGQSSACLPSGNLTSWARQGVLLLNSTLTVQAGESNSHKDFGWQIMTDEVIRLLSQRREHLVFILWGNHAQSKKVLIDDDRHLVLEAPHPSPLSAHRGFFGSKPFSRCNQFLMQHNHDAINW